MTKKILLIIILLCIGCKEDNTNGRLPLKTMTVCRDDSSLYFPVLAFDSLDHNRDKSVNKWYSNQLAAMKEPIVRFNLSDTVIRFTWLRTFHHPISVRLFTDNGKVKIHAIELDGAGGYNAGSTFRELDTNITKNIIVDFLNYIDEIKFDTISAVENSDGKDGSEWIIEISINGRYHFVNRWSPKNGNIYQFGIRLLNQTGWKFKSTEFY